MEEEVKTGLETEPTPTESNDAPDVSEDYTADIEEETDEEDSDEDLELEYDDDGNVVIPGDDTEEAGDTTPGTDEQTPSPEPEPPAKVDGAELDRLRRDLSYLRNLSRDTLKKLGYEGDDPVEGLIRAAAEADGISVEEYKRALAKEQRRAEEERTAFEEGMRAKMTADLAAVKAEIPAAAAYNSVEEFPNYRRFGELCDLGLTPAEAFRASHPKEVADGIAASVTQAAKDSKDHLRSSVPRGARDTSTTIPSAELAEYREIFPGKSDKEIAALYRRATK